MSGLVRALVSELASDPVAVEQLRTLLEIDSNQQRAAPAPAFTVRSLAEEIGRSERSVRDAITRRELKAVKRGRGYLTPPPRWKPGQRLHRSQHRGPRARLYTGIAGAHAVRCAGP
jgi:hypothetical protein